MGIGDSINLGVNTNVQSSISAATGFAASITNSISTKTSLPWQNSSINSKFFPYLSIDPSRWDQLYPYRLLVIDAKNNQVVLGNGGALPPSQISLTVSQTPGQGGTGSALISFLPSTPVWIFQLPISPNQLAISDQFAIQTSATLRGITEEHSGVRFKLINASGSMGVWAQRSSVTKPPTPPSALQSLFAGTLQSAGNLVNQVNNLVNTATTGHPASKPVSLLPPTSDFGETSTGYYQALKLAQFLEQYAEAKRDPSNASWRLVFDIPKQNQSFVVTPTAYDWQQNANKPMEIMYRFQLKAWRRIDLKQTVTPQPTANQPIDSNVLQRILNTINQSQQVLSAALSLIGAVRTDVETPLNALRQTVLFVKGLAGVALTAADLPSQIISDYSNSISQSINILASTIKSNISDPSVTASITAVQAVYELSEGISTTAVANGQLGSAAAANLSLSPASNIYRQPLSQFVLMDQVPTSSLTLTNAQQAFITNMQTQAAETTIAQLKAYRNTIQQLSIQLSNNFGSGSSYYNNLFGLPAPTTRIQPITLDEYSILSSLYETMSCYDILTASTAINDLAIESSMEYVAGLASTSNIPFDIPNSKIMAPVPFGLSIEGISARYLGDQGRWIEIATLNNLREPYIDENGFQLPLLSNATGRQISVSSNVNLFIGQKVILQGANQTPSPRVILNMEQLSDTNFLLTLDGLANLQNFTTSAQSYMQAYLPGTVNSQQKIFIPSDLPVPAVSNITPPSSTSSDPYTGLSKVDWLLTDTGDLAINNYGDFRYASGITNLIQALRIKFGTRASTVLTHPTFGLNIQAGSMTTDLQIQELYNAINLMVTQDPRFAAVSQLQIKLENGTLGINMAVQLPNQTGVFPVSFALTS